MYVVGAKIIDAWTLDRYNLLHPTFLLCKITGFEVYMTLLDANLPLIFNAFPFFNLFVQLKTKIYKFSSSLGVHLNFL